MSTYNFTVLTGECGACKREIDVTVQAQPTAILDIVAIHCMSGARDASNNVHEIVVEIDYKE